MALILILEDDIEMNSLMSLTLRLENYEVLQAHTGTQAIELAIKHMPDLILSDVMLPGLTGYDVAHALRDHPRTANIPIIFVTAKNEIEDRIAALELGADFLGKPFGTPELMARIRNALRTQRLIKEMKDIEATLEQYKSLLSPAVKRSKIFLCHAQEDKPIVRELEANLSAQGFNTWLDEKDILPGEDWDLAITKALTSADIALICLSCHSIQKRGYVQKEVKIALDVLDQMPEGRTFLIPVLLEPCDLPIRLSSRQSVKLYHPQGMDLLIRAITVQLLNIHQEGV